jgi:hypothetical protein
MISSSSNILKIRVDFIVKFIYNFLNCDITLILFENMAISGCEVPIIELILLIFRLIATLFLFYKYGVGNFEIVR